MATFHSGNGGKLKLGAAGADINVAEWTLTLSARLGEATHSGTAAVLRKKVIEDGQFSANLPWDSTQLLGTTVLVGPGDEIAELRLFLGDSTKFFSFAAIIETLVHVCNNTNDIVRATITGYVNSAPTYPA